ncbi:uncharacterized protein LOC105219898 isoform X2 [Zeugodacus cucurbitae]|uniref:uncharacterized protein LOC105219898 isoform X2 n=1 Tax=Zeugodacus cucurbitae TaxID=28588 RepID=UPI0023D91BFD|nr:uncharacterized protein LOC105219898 isoform X2 [Zeugodacus cucurbitae]
MTSYATVNDSNNAATATTTSTMDNTNVANAATTLAASDTMAGGAENVDGTRNFHTTIDRCAPYESPTTPTTYDCDVPRKLGEQQQQQQQLQDQQLLLLDTPTSNCCTDYECDSFSDGHEKTDTTPENLKKIDDVIEQQAQLQQLKNRSSSSHYLSNTQQAAATNAANAYDRDIVGAGYGVGLAVAVDDSNAKFCFGKPLCNEKDMLSKSERIESHSHIHGHSIDCSTVDLGKSRRVADGNGSDSGCVTPSTMSELNAATLLASGADNSESLPHDDDSSASNATNTTTTATANKQSYAFTIDNFNDSGCDPEAAKARYKSMMERFQSRHRRGASMSKLEAGDVAANKETTMTSSVSATPLSGSASANTRHARQSGGAADNSFDSGGGGADVPKVKLRVRDRSTSRVRDASKRHSWSPRSSTQESQLHAHAGQHAVAQTPTAPRTNHHGANERAHAAQKPLPPTRKNVSKQKPPPLQLPKGAANLVANRTQFTPRSTAMQLALQKVDFLCAQPPLAELKNYNLEADNISETGTYTLDGDNYTEEQKDLMNIDKSAQQALKAQQQRPKNLQLSSSVVDVDAQLSNTKIPVHVNNRSNVLEVNYYHDAEADPQCPQSPRAYNERDLILGTHESAGAYLEKIKSRVLRNASATKSAPPQVEIAEKTPTEDDGDLGCFTSVTTSGVLAKKSALDPRPRLTRKSGLSTSQIDSSEYVSNEMKLKANTASAYSGGGFTDHQKAEYRLNLFTNQKDSNREKFAATRSYIESPPDTPTHQKLSDAAVLKTAQTKNDWIQEWARNARARSLASDTSKTRIHPDASQSALMTRSYTCASDTAAGGDSLTDDSIYNSKQCISAAKLNRSLAERYRLSGECDYSSDPTLSSGAYSSGGQPAEGICKPPKSPSKIPSPLHSIGRARSASRTRAPLQNVMLQGGVVGDEEADIYLQKTAAAINNLQQSLSRKNSLKSPPTTHSSASPRAHSARSHAHSAALYSPPDDCGSPQHGLGSPTSAASGSAYHHSPLHRRVATSQEPYGSRNAQHLQLMTSSFNEQQLKLLTSGEYLARQMRARKNSFDGNISNSPARRAAVAAANAQAQAAQSGQESPLRRSSSLSAKIATTQRAARPQFSNIYTPPAARHNYSLVGGGDGQSAAAAGHKNASIIKKSASSNNFRHAIGDYDENFQYYINDEDDMGEEYYSSGAEEVEEEEEDDNDHYYHQHDDDVQAEVENTAAVPLSNTRLNKALLMRIERSKQRVSGTSGTAKPSSAPVTKLQQQQQAAGSCGVMACPNTPELPRRGIRSAPRSGGATTTRQSVPRDTSLSRLASQVPNSLASAKKQLLQTAAAVPSTTTKLATGQRVQPKYLDISKYKPAQGNNFLRKNDSKSTLKTSALSGDMMKRSPSSSSMGLTRADPTRTSNRSVRSVASCMTTSGTTLGGGGGGGGYGMSGRASSAVRRDQSVTKQKEAEMAMWKRRSTYDPMKAAAEDRRKKEEAKRLALAKNMGEMPCESATRTPPPFKQQLSLDEQWTEYGEEECV